MSGDDVAPPGAQPVLEYRPPEPDRHRVQWFMGGLLLSFTSLVAGVAAGALVSYTTSSNWAFAIVLAAIGVFLAAVGMLVRPPRRKPFALGILSGCGVAACVEGLCFLSFNA